MSDGGAQPVNTAQIAAMNNFQGGPAGGSGMGTEIGAAGAIQLEGIMAKSTQGFDQATEFLNAGAQTGMGATTVAMGDSLAAGNLLPVRNLGEVGSPVNKDTDQLGGLRTPAAGVGAQVKDFQAGLAPQGRGG